MVFWPIACNGIRKERCIETLTTVSTNGPCGTYSNSFEIKEWCFLWDKPLEAKPSCLHTTLASTVFQPSAQIVCQSWLSHTCTIPIKGVEPSTKRKSKLLQRGSIEQKIVKVIVHMLKYESSCYLWGTGGQHLHGECSENSQSYFEDTEKECFHFLYTEFHPVELVLFLHQNVQCKHLYVWVTVWSQA